MKAATVPRIVHFGDNTVQVSQNPIKAAILASLDPLIIDFAQTPSGSDIQMTAGVFFRAS